MAPLASPPHRRFDPTDAWVRDAIEIRHALHQAPELSGQEEQTAARVAARLKSWGYDVTTGIGGHGVVGTLRRGDGSRALGLRADMDALPIEEASGAPFASRTPGVMHACGHDGHVAILLGAARYLAEHGAFSGTLNLIFQPAEESGGGARKMIADGLFERFPCDAVYGLHNWPNIPAGVFGFVDGPAMAAVDLITITIVGKGGHGAAPQETADPIVAAAHLITALQTIVSRNVDPLESAVVTVGSIHGGDAPNVIPDSVTLQLTVRTFAADVRERVARRIRDLASGTAQTFGARAEIIVRKGYPSVRNHAREVAFARDVARTLFGPEHIDDSFPPRMASEDFAYMLEARPGAFIFVGAGPGEPLHSPRYAFNDDLIAPAAALWVALAEAYLA